MDARLPRVAVLLSTYNGARFLDEQLDSLRHQRNVEVLLHARDDGSTDDTLAVLARHAERWPSLGGVASGPNLGPAASFLELLRTAPDDADYYAFCDQDDVWLPEKLERAVSFIASDEGPALYCSNVTCVDEKLNMLGAPAPNGDARFQHLLFENIAYGCTTVINRSAQRIIADRLPSLGAAAMHDWWCALAVASVGKVIYDPQPTILYRQHAANVVGSTAGVASKLWKLALQAARRPRTFYRIHAQADELMRLFGPDLPPQQRRLAERLVQSKRSLPKRLAYALSQDITRHRAIDACAARGLLALGWY